MHRQTNTENALPSMFDASYAGIIFDSKLAPLKVI